MKAVILAAGEGRRLRPLTFTRPKVLVPVANRPILEHLILQARAAGFSEFTLVVGYHGDKVRDYFGDGRAWGVTIDYADQRRQLGTGHALQNLEGRVKGQFLVLNGDIFVSGADIGKVAQGSGMALGIAQVRNPRDYGTVTFDGRRLTGIYEKVAEPPSDWANAGVYLFTEDIFPALARINKSPRGELEVTDALQQLIDGGYNLGYQQLSSWREVSYPWNLLELNESFLSSQEFEEQVQGQVEAGAVLQGRVSLGKGTVVRSGSYIQGPVAIGADCQIGPNCYLRPCTAIGDSCHIGSGVEVKNSIVMRGSNIPHHNYVGDSILGEGCNLGAGTKIANLRLDDQPVVMGGIPTGRRKLGAILGDGVKTGINASINVGSLVGARTQVWPGAVASGEVMPNTVIK